MIVSHKHRFIFLKTRKTGGTSIEIALRSLCGDDDIITPIVEDRSGPLGRRPQNFLFPPAEWSASDLADWVRGKRPNFCSQHRVGFYNHIPAAEVQQRLGEDTWANYFKFSVERNPWDRQVSYYHWYCGEPYATPQSFTEFTRRLSRFRTGATTRSAMASLLITSSATMATFVPASTRPYTMSACRRRHYRTLRLHGDRGIGATGVTMMKISARRLPAATSARSNISGGPTRSAIAWFTQHRMGRWNRL